MDSSAFQRMVNPTFTPRSSGVRGVNPVSVFLNKAKSKRPPTGPFLSSIDEDGLRFILVPPGPAYNLSSDSDDDEEIPLPVKGEALKGVRGRSSFTVGEFFKTLNQHKKKEAPAAKNKPGGGTTKEDDEALYVRVDMPGLTKDDVKVSFEPEKQSLIIKGEDAEKENSYSKEVSVPSEKFKVDEMKAEIRNGVLKVMIPRMQKKDAIPVKVD